MPGLFHTRQASSDMRDTAALQMICGALILAICAVIVRIAMMA